MIRIKTRIGMVATHKDITCSLELRALLSPAKKFSVYVVARKGSYPQIAHLRKRYR